MGLATPEIPNGGLISFHLCDYKSMFGSAMHTNIPEVSLNAHCGGTAVVVSECVCVCRVCPQALL